MNRALSLAMLVLSATATPALAASRPQATEKLYLAFELRQDGKVVGTPKLLGELGKALRAERRQPGANLPDYSLAVMPVQFGDHFQIDLDVTLPKAEGHGNLFVQHGEQRKVELGAKPGDLVVSLTVMKVNSPEFKALMNLIGTQERQAKSTSI
jgi:hypothetical protein